MDLQAKIAARRAEIERQAKEAKEAQREELERRQRLQKDHRTRVLDEVAQEITSSGTSVVRRDDRLVLAETPPIAFVDPADLKAAALKDLLNREARQRWSASENWLFIGFVTAGVLALLPAFPIGALLIGVGVICRQTAMGRHRRALAMEYPHLFDRALSPDKTATT